MSPVSTPSTPGPGEPGRRSPRSQVTDPRRPFAAGPFTRMARAHAASVAGDALFVIALAGSVFFSLDFDAARWRVALYLVLTIAPFAVAAPLIGPALDRIPGGRRWVVVASMAARAVLAVFVIRHLDSIWFYPEAFLMLVFAKVYSISKSALVPTTVRSDDDLVKANSRLAVLSAVSVVVVAPVGGIFLKLGGPGWVLGLCAVVFVGATVLGFQLPAATVATQPEGEAEREELRGAGIVLAVSAIGTMRAIVGFLTFMLAFAFKNDDAPLWYLGAAAVAAQAGVFGGAVLAPVLRRHAREQVIMASCLVAVVVGGLACAFIGGLAAATLLSLLVGASSNAAKQAFDALVQQDAPDANRGRSFARFETRFQLFWVIGALIPIVVPIPMSWGFAAIALLAAVSAVSYLVGQQQVKKGRVPVRHFEVRRIRVRRRRRGPGAAEGTEGAAVPPPAPAGGPTPPGEDAAVVADASAAVGVAPAPGRMASPGWARSSPSPSPGGGRSRPWGRPSTAPPAAVDRDPDGPVGGPAGEGGPLFDGAAFFGEHPTDPGSPRPDPGSPRPAPAPPADDRTAVAPAPPSPPDDDVTVVQPRLPLPGEDPGR